MIRKALWLVVPVALGAAVAGGRQDIIRFLKMKQMSLGSAGRPEVVPADGAISYPQDTSHAEPDGTGEFDSARRGGPAQATPGPTAPGEVRRALRPGGQPRTVSPREGGQRAPATPGRARLPHVAGARNAGALVADARGRDASNGISRGATTVDSRTALVERVTQGEPLSCSRVC